MYHYRLLMRICPLGLLVLLRGDSILSIYRSILISFRILTHIITRFIMAMVIFSAFLHRAHLHLEEGRLTSLVLQPLRSKERAQVRAEMTIFRSPRLRALSLRGSIR